MAQCRFKATLLKSENVNLSLVGTNDSIECFKTFIHSMGDIPAHDVKDLLLCMKERKIFGYFECKEEGYERFCEDANKELEKDDLLIDEDEWYTALFYTDPEEWLQLSEEDYEMFMSKPDLWDEIFEDCGAYKIDEQYDAKLLLLSYKLLDAKSVKEAKTVMEGMTDFQLKLFEVMMKRVIDERGIEVDQYMKEHPEVKAQADELKAAMEKNGPDYSFIWKMI